MIIGHKLSKVLTYKNTIQQIILHQNALVPDLNGMSIQRDQAIESPLRNSSLQRVFVCQ